ncbi:phage holin family protein [Microlunatus flavus]|uniref:Putative Holin-X, holin superfamily III n=1 Tax=Microlunatus flavus TaxID=1036181 RepID=A0A1H8ZM84_9ACTN|nr:phage holin family protein [Microlunatus flavus]SEP65639.1 Putative Holin-X, holin superfamily III [Microlunatus flavus]
MAEQGVGEIVRAISDDVKELVRDEVQLAKAELVPAAKAGGIGAGLLAGAAFFGVSAVFILYFCVVYVLVRLGLPEWASFLIVGAALLLLAALLGAVGYSMIKKVKAPQRTIKQAKETVDAVKASAQQTLAAIKGSKDDTKAISR